LDQREEVSGECRRLHKEEEIGGHVARTGEKRNAYDIWVGKSEVKRQLGRHRRRWKTITEEILGKLGRKLWTGFIWLRAGTSARLL